MSDVQQYLAALFLPAPDRAEVELRFISQQKGPNGKALFAYTKRARTWEDVRALLDGRYASLNAYIGCGWRVAGTMDGSLSNVAGWAFVWADVDGEITKDIDPPPSAHVHSGHGNHLYWRLRVPAGRERLETVHRVLRGLALRVGADMRAAEPARVLRLPDTLNHKDDPSLPVSLVGVWPDRVYDLDELPQADAPEPATESSAPLPVPVPPLRIGERLRLLVEHGWSEGCGFPSASELDYAVAQEMLRAGHTDAEVVWVFKSPVFGFSRGKHRRDDYIQRTIANAKADLPKAAPARVLDSYSMDEAVAADWPIVLPIMDRMLYPQSISLLAGPPKVGKSFFIQQMLVSLISGQMFLDQYAVLERVPCLHFTAETPKEQYLQRWMQSFDASYRTSRAMLSYTSAKAVNIIDNYDSVCSLIDSRKPKVVVFDTWRRYHRAEENDSTQMQLMIEQCDRLLERFDLSLVLVHHTKKAMVEDVTDAFDLIRGSSVLRASPNVNLVLLPFREGTTNGVATKFRLYKELNFDAPEAPMTLTRPNGGLFEREQVTRVQSDDLVTQIVRATKGRTISFNSLLTIIQREHGIARVTMQAKLHGGLPPGIRTERRDDGQEWLVYEGGN